MNKEIQVVEGNGKELKISDVHDHLPSVRPKSNSEKRKDIVIPKSKEIMKKRKIRKFKTK